MGNSESLNLEIRPYENIWRNSFEEFRNKAILEGNDSLSKLKLDVDSFKGQLLLCFLKDKLVSISACEPSHYTGDPHIAARVCRYHVLSQVRNQFLFCGFQMLQHHCKWADQNNFQIVYFTQNVENKPLNALYRRKRKYSLGAQNTWFDDPTFKSFELNEKRVFKVSEKSDLLQFVYARKRNPNYNWRPTERMVDMPSEIVERYL